MFLNLPAIWVSSRCNCGWGAQAGRHGDTIDVCGTFWHRSVQCNATAPAKTSKAITGFLAVGERIRAACTPSVLPGLAASGSRSTSSVKSERWP
jgi:hypothetical protein